MPLNGLRNKRNVQATSEPRSRKETQRKTSMTQYSPHSRQEGIKEVHTIDQTDFSLQTEATSMHNNKLQRKVGMGILLTRANSEGRMGSGIESLEQELQPEVN